MALEEISLDNNAWPAAGLELDQQWEVLRQDLRKISSALRNVLSDIDPGDPANSALSALAFGELYFRNRARLFWDKSGTPKVKVQKNTGTQATPIWTDFLSYTPSTGVFIFIGAVTITGTFTLTGDLDMQTNNITNVGTVNGMTVDGSVAGLDVTGAVGVVGNSTVLARANHTHRGIHSVDALYGDVTTTISSSNAGSALLTKTIVGNDIRLALAGPERDIKDTFTYVSGSTVKLARRLGQNIWVDIDGVPLSSATDITWNLATLLGGGEATSTWYYLYLNNVAGVLTPQISTTGPVMDAGAGKINYHPTNTGWRFVQAVRNDATSDIIPFDEVSPGIVQWRYQTESAIQTLALGSSAPVTSYAGISIAGFIPLSARFVLIGLDSIAYWLTLYVGPESLVGQTISDHLTQTHSFAGANASAYDWKQINYWIPVDQTPVVAWGAIKGTIPFEISYALNVIGWK